MLDNISPAQDITEFCTVTVSELGGAVDSMLQSVGLNMRDIPGLCEPFAHLPHLPSISWSKYFLYYHHTKSPPTPTLENLCVAHSLAPSNAPDGVHLDWQSYLEQSVHCIVSLVLKS